MPEEGVSMVEEIGKVKLNYEFYRGTDAYSDGEIENDLLNLVKEEENVDRILQKEIGRAHV